MYSVQGRKEEKEVDLAKQWFHHRGHLPITLFYILVYRVIKIPTPVVSSEMQPNYIVARY